MLVPKALDDLRTAVQDYLYMECGDGNDIRIDNMLPDEYAEFLINEHREEKELQKTMKVRVSLFLKDGYGSVSSFAK